MQMRRLGLLMMACAVLAVAGTAGAVDFDLKLKVDPDTEKRVNIENAMTKGRDFINHVGIYLRFIPKDADNEQFPVFIDTENYLSCKDSEAKVTVNDVKQVHTHDRTGIKVYAFFFDKPECTDPTFHLKAIFGDS